MRKKIFVLVFLFASLLGISTLAGCATDYKYSSNDVPNYDVLADAQDIFLSKGETSSFDFKKKFERTGIDITKIVAKSTDENVFTVKDNKITATGMGQAKVSVEIYSKKEDTCYYTTYANVYVIDENNVNLIEIYTPEDLALMNQNKSGWYILKDNIDLSDWGDWEPIGNLPLEESKSSENNSFTGIFINPYHYKISNLSIKTSKNIPHGIYGGCYGGLFGTIEDAYIDGIILENVFIDLADDEGHLSSAAGGVAAGALNSIIRNCKVEGIIISQDRSGGIIGGASWGRIIGCNFKGSVTSTQHGAGGIAGFGYIVKDCNVNATIEGYHSSGGILGFVTTQYFISDCTFIGELLGDGNIGEIIGDKDI